MARRKGNGKARTKPLMKRFKESPIPTAKAQIKQLGPWKYPLGLIGAGLISIPFADELVSAGSKISPSLGNLMSVFTGAGKNLGIRLRS